MEKLLANEKHLLSDCKVIKGGKISQFGTVHILLNSVQEPEGNIEIGLECWSKTLYQLRLNNNFKAKIDDNHLVIYDETKKSVSDIAVTDIFSMTSRYGCTVMSDGWLMADYLTEKYGKSKAEEYVGALLNAEKGKNPGVLNEGFFTKISPKLIGSSVICLLHKGPSKKDILVKVFTNEGFMLDSKTSWPLIPGEWAQAK